MSTNQQYGAGTVLEYGGLTSPPSYVAIGGITKDYKGNKTAGVTDISTHDTMAVDRTKRKGGTTIDEGKYTFELFSDLTDTQHQALRDNVSKTAYFRLTPANYSPAKKKTFQAVIVGVSDTYPMEGYQTWSIELDITAPATWA